MTTLTQNQNTALKQIVDSVIESIKTAGEQGVSGGHLYAALMAYGCSLNQFESLMSALVKLNKVQKQGHVYTVKA